MDEELPAASKGAKCDGLNKCKRTFVLGVVDISGIKCTSANRKRRWDQLPEEDSEIPSKVAMIETSEANDATSENPDISTIASNSTSQSEMTFDVGELNEANCINTVKFPINMDDIPLPDSTSPAQSLVDSPTKVDKLQVPSEALVVQSVDEIPVPLENIDRISSDNQHKLNLEYNSVSQSSSEKSKQLNKTFNQIEPALEKKDAANSVPVKAIISDSLKQIQCCYDEDSNSSQSSGEAALDVEKATSVSVPTPKSEETLEKDEVDESITSKSEGYGIDNTLNLNVLKQAQRNERSPTPVLPESDEEPETFEDKVVNLRVNNASLLENAHDTPKADVLVQASCGGPEQAQDVNIAKELEAEKAISLDVTADQPILEKVNFVKDEAAGLSEVISVKSTSSAEDKMDLVGDSVVQLDSKQTVPVAVESVLKEAVVGSVAEVPKQLHSFSGADVSKGSKIESLKRLESKVDLPADVSEKSESEALKCVVEDSKSSEVETTELVGVSKHPEVCPLESIVDGSEQCSVEAAKLVANASGRPDVPIADGDGIGNSFGVGENLSGGDVGMSLELEALEPVPDGISNSSESESVIGVPQPSEAVEPLDISNASGLGSESIKDVPKSSQVEVVESVPIVSNSVLEARESEELVTKSSKMEPVEPAVDSILSSLEPEASEEICKSPEIEAVEPALGDIPSSSEPAMDAINPAEIEAIEPAVDDTSYSELGVSESSKDVPKLPKMKVVDPIIDDIPSSLEYATTQAVPKSVEMEAVHPILDSISKSEAGASLSNQAIPSPPEAIESTLDDVSNSLELERESIDDVSKQPVGEVPELPEPFPNAHSIEATNSSVEVTKQPELVTTNSVSPQESEVQEMDDDIEKVTERPKVDVGNKNMVQESPVVKELDVEVALSVDVSQQSNETRQDSVPKEHDDKIMDSDNSVGISQELNSESDTVNADCVVMDQPVAHSELVVEDSIQSEARGSLGSEHQPSEHPQSSQTSNGIVAKEDTSVHTLADIESAKPLGSSLIVAPRGSSEMSEKVSDSVDALQTSNEAGKPVSVIENTRSESTEILTTLGGLSNNEIEQILDSSVELNKVDVEMTDNFDVPLGKGPDIPENSEGQSIVNIDAPKSPKVSKATTVSKSPIKERSTEVGETSTDKPVNPPEEGSSKVVREKTENLELDMTLTELDKLNDVSESTNNLVDGADTSKMLVEESSDKEAKSFNKPFQPTNQITFMDNSQNCVGFDDLNCVNKAPAKSTHEVSSSETVEHSDKLENNQTAEVTMHFASVRAQEKVLSNTDDEVEKDESALAIDALISANPELSEKAIDFEEQANMDLNTMDMLDSLVRRSSMDDQSQVREGLLSEDSLINEINQLPDREEDESKKSSDGVRGLNPPVSDTTGDAIGSKTNKGVESVEKDSEVAVVQESVSSKENLPNVTSDLKKRVDKAVVEEPRETEESSTDEIEVTKPEAANSPAMAIPPNSKESTIEGNTENVNQSVNDENTKSKVKSDDSELQLRDEEIEMENAEIVMVDPTKPLSGEDSENEAEALENKNKKKPISDVPVSVLPPVEPPVEVEPAVSNEEPPTKKQKREKAARQGRSNAKVDAASEQQVDYKSTETPKDLNKKIADKSDSKTKQDKISDQDVSSKEPSLPVLVIKKQSLPSKKDPEKKVSETLTCSPKPVETSDFPSLSRNKHNEVLHIETGTEPLAEARSPKHSPITLRIFKDNLTVKTDLDSPKRNKSPLSSEFKSELSPHLKSPVRSDSLSPQMKQLEFTLKIAKDASTNQPKATMSPKNVASPSSVWKSEVQTPESSVTLKEVEESPVVRGSRGRGRTPRGAQRRGVGRGRRGGAGRGRLMATPEPMTIKPEECRERLAVDVVIKQEVVTDDSGTASSSASEHRTPMQDLFRKIITKESLVPVESPQNSGVVGVDPLVPIKRKRGRPRKNPIISPPEPLIIKTEPEEPMETLGSESTPSTPVNMYMTPGLDSDLPNDSSSGRPKRMCRGRTKPIVVKKRKPRGGGVGGSGISREPVIFMPSSAEIKQEPMTPQSSSTDPMDTSTSTTPNISAADLAPSPAFTPPARGRGGFKRPTPDRNTLSEKELAELQKIEAKKEKLRLDRIAKYEAKKAKKLAKKLKDEERRKRLAREKAEKAEAAAPQVFEEETRMSAPDSGSRGHTPAPNRFSQGESGIGGDESQNSISTPGDTNKGNKKGRMEISITDLDCLIKEIRVDDLAEYQWQGSELYMIQEQVSLYLGVKSFKRKYPCVKRRPVEAEERTFLEDSGLVPKSMCDLGLTAVSSAEILDIMYQDFPDKYEEFRKHVRDKQAREASFKQKAAIGLQRKDGTKVEPREQALEAVAAWNANLNRERREERRCALDLQTFTVHYPKVERNNMKKSTPKLGLYPVAVIPGQFCDHFKKYTPTELMYFPINTVVYGPLKPNERHKETGSDEGSNSESSSSSSSSSSSGESSSESESEGEDPPKCTMCNGTKKKNKDNLPEVLLCCSQCKACYHPSCKEMTPEMTPHLTKYEWLCTACKKCSKCTDPNLKDRIMCCQLCDRGYHLTCIGLKKMPEGRWHCSVCAYCSSCGSRSPGGSDWQHEFKKGEKGSKIYQRTLCTPCFKLWRKGKYCQLCSKCHCMKPEEDHTLIQCNSCDRWLHKDCYSTKYGVQSKLLSTSSIQCDVCVERIQSTLSSPSLARPLIKV